MPYFQNFLRVINFVIIANFSGHNSAYLKLSSLCDSYLPSLQYETFLPLFQSVIDTFQYILIIIVIFDSAEKLIEIS